MGLFEGKKVLITGATGLIGTWLVNELLKEDAFIIAVGRNEEKIKSIFGEKISNSNFDYKVFDIAQGAPADIGAVDFIFHAASPISGKEIKERPVDVINVNIDGVKNCLEYLRIQKKDTQVNGRLIIFSSATVYGNSLKEDRIVFEADAKQSDIPEDVNAPYSESKRLIEVLAHAYHKQYGVDSVIARIGWVYGFARNMPDTAFYEFIRKAVQEENIVLKHGGLARRDNIYVSDVVKGLVLLALRGESGETYNISSGCDRGNFKAIDEIAEIMASCINKLTGKRNVHAIIPIQSDLKRKPGTMLNNNKLKKLGWTVEMSIQDGIMETLEQYIRLHSDFKDAN